MLRRVVVLTAICFIALGLCTGCTRNEISETTIPDPTVPSFSESMVAEEPFAEEIVVEGFAYLDDLWVVRGIYYENNLIDVYDNDALKDLYDSDCMTFFGDGTFHYMSLFNRRGEYTRQEDGTFLLKTESVFTYDFTSEGLVEKEVTNSAPKPYLITPLDDNTFLLNEFDPMMGKAAADSTDYVFVRDGKDSVYLSTNKTKINNDSEKPDQSEPEQSGQDVTNMPEETQKPSYNSDTVSSGQTNALQSAKNYLAVMPFSYSGLVEQLEYEGYSHSEATYAADNCGADWYEQAVKAAENYLDVMAFSRTDLIEQLEYEGYTHDQAVYGVDQAY